jgi:hypothetical protein
VIALEGAISVVVVEVVASEGAISVVASEVVASEGAINMVASEGARGKTAELRLIKWWIMLRNRVRW